MPHICSVCGHRHDDEVQMEAFDRLPEDWRCPVCKASKTAFRTLGIDYTDGDG